MSRVALLYVDDDDDIRAIAELALGLDPTLDVRTAPGGAAALALLDGGAGWRPDVALLDVMMPEMGGVELARHLRTRPGLGRLPIIFMTARARAGDISEYTAIGQSAMIAKPFDPMTLAATVRERLRGIHARG
ncbi:response regulator [Sphingomonas morindae]|uniref:Response regulator n=1 Tax=Sphingomonas morindae TaxID=1541170 RepID=A0ABY4X486_9SPHN|nr:response regulator [Sphingomonas morindae]USI71695.1 response regulator [Sphingomonas morindae]